MKLFKPLLLIAITIFFNKMAMAEPTVETKNLQEQGENSKKKSYFSFWNFFKKGPKKEHVKKETTTQEGPNQGIGATNKQDTLTPKINKPSDTQITELFEQNVKVSLDLLKNTLTQQETLKIFTPKRQVGFKQFLADCLNKNQNNWDTPTINLNKNVSTLLENLSQIFDNIPQYCTLKIYELFNNNTNPNNLNLHKAAHNMEEFINISSSNFVEEFTKYMIIDFLQNHYTKITGQKTLALDLIKNTQIKLECSNVVVGTVHLYENLLQNPQNLAIFNLFTQCEKQQQDELINSVEDYLDFNTGNDPFLITQNRINRLGIKITQPQKLNKVIQKINSSSNVKYIINCLLELGTKNMHSPEDEQVFNKNIDKFKKTLIFYLQNKFLLDNNYDFLMLYPFIKKHSNLMDLATQVFSHKKQPLSGGGLKLFSYNLALIFAQNNEPLEYFFNQMEEFEKTHQIKVKYEDFFNKLSDFKKYLKTVKLDQHLKSLKLFFYFIYYKKHIDPLEILSKYKQYKEIFAKFIHQHINSL